MNELTIAQVREIVGWSYPTALDFAKRTGAMIDGKWYVPFDIVAAEVQKRVVVAQKMQGRLIASSNGQ